MLKLKDIKSVYFIGIGGIGMSALARFFKQQGMNVAGYDRTPTPLTDTLKQEGIEVRFDDDVESIPQTFKDKQSCLVVFTPAVPVTHAELQYFKKNNFQVKKRAEVLGLLTRGMEGVCVAGTHGKTTISSMTAHLMKQSEVGCNAFLGGITRNYATNFLLDEHSSYVVMEADEFDRSFLHLTPHLALVSAMDADHLDVYGEASKVYEAFNEFVQLISPGGALLYKEGLPLELPDDDVEVFTYSAKEEGDFYPFNLKLVDGLYKFSLKTPFGKIHHLKMGVPGLLNVENAVGAIGLSLLAGVDEDEIREALPNFKGIRRRFEYRIREENLVYIDDYAHHPEEINATVASVRALYPGKQLTVVFQPHLFTRTRDFADGFAEALDKCDRVFLLDIYPAREEPIEGVTSQMIVDRMQLEKVKLLKYYDLKEELKSDVPEVILTLGAGDIDKLTDDLEGHLKLFIFNE
ncbi:UDP-N-acetylmuramate--L-alanine ligase [Carboxylicivirga caseinilyticus]|uniref:UDP-N-acetylmuramate--L-alanine ligase n=1 Tax=Carboxylicivirga caseinilyticus TaxID=3417572 RepID=UPI003D33DD20|nr:UDP-N-acetylmuramate--L-alanine ligase [Marinilabiliaceae bacterium A049]